MKMSRIACTLAVALAAAPALAEEQPVELKSAPGAELVSQTCGSCHSLDYIRMNSPFLSSDIWKAEVAKMRAAFGAIMDDADAATIQKYLADNYGLPAS
jgi:mono/diheme cytochrome c family protein